MAQNGIIMIEAQQGMTIGNEKCNDKWRVLLNRGWA